MNIPISVILLFLGSGYWLFTQRDNLGIFELLSNNQQQEILLISPTPTDSPTSSFIPTLSPSPKIEPTNKPITPPNQTAWEKKQITGIYLSRYQITNNAK
ncbi:MAG: hypothetical protein VKN72_26230 [Nostocales cyanobacterium 94392]|nr:hypothetical protein [Nostocales cyanobacterium 94392]